MTKVAASKRRRESVKAGKKKKGKRSVKTQLRSLQRLLNKDDIGQKAKKMIQGKIEGLTKVYKDHKQSEREQQMAVRYHRVKFFERVKLERRRDALQKKLQTDRLSKGHQQTASLLGQTEEDLQYVLHFPKGERYVSLLKQAADPAAQEALDAERSRLKALVRQRLADERMLTEVDEGRHVAQHKATEAGETGTNPSATKPATSVPSSSAPSQLAQKAKKVKQQPAKRQKLMSQQSQPAENLEDDDFFLDSTQAHKEDDDQPQAGFEEKAKNPNKHKAERDRKGKVGSSKKGQKHEMRETKHSKPRQAPAKVTNTSGKAADVEASQGIQKGRTRAEGGRKRRKKQRG